jgi:hypothetical protein
MNQQLARNCGYVLICLLLVTAPARTQTNVVKVKGLITDVNGAVVPNVTVKFIDRHNRNLSFTSITNENGEYQVVPKSGFYDITASKPGSGFSETRRAPIAFTLEASVVINMTLFSRASLLKPYANAKSKESYDDLVSTPFEYDQLNITGDKDLSVLVRFAVKESKGRQVSEYRGASNAADELSRRAELTYDLFDVVADRLVIDQKTSIITAAGNIRVIHNGETRIRADNLRFQLRNGRMNVIGLTLD